MDTPTLDYSHKKAPSSRRVILLGLNILACLVLVLVIAFIMWATWLPAITSWKE